MVSRTYCVARTLAAVCYESIEVSAMARRIPDVILKLQQLARPTFVDGRWRKPKISARKLAVLRKSLVVDGVWWPPRPLRDRGADKPLKLRKWERQKEERQAFYTYVCPVLFYLVHKSPSRTGNTMHTFPRALTGKSRLKKTCATCHRWWLTTGRRYMN